MTKTRRVIALLFAMTLLLTSCGQIPTSGPVGQSDSGNPGRDVTTYSFNPESPQEGASAEDIVLGFIRAGTGPSEDYKVAREYLGGDLAAEWNPVAETLVHNGEPSVTPGSEDGEFLVQLELAATIDANGVMTPARVDSTKAVQIRVEQVGEEYRIVEAPDGTIVHANQFQVLFSSQKLYFFDPTYQYLVPDIRWFVNRTGFAAAVVDALLEGPAPYLKSAVFSAFPEGSELSRAAVPVDNGQAMVDFTQEVIADADGKTRRRMHTQLLATLDQITTVQDVVMTTDQREVDLGQVSPGEEESTINPTVGSTQIAVHNGALVYFEGSSAVPIGSMPNITHTDPAHPAMNQRGTSFAFLNGEQTQLFTINESRALGNPLSGENLTWPSFDGAGWAWTVNNTGPSPQVSAFPVEETDGSVRTLNASWLDGKHVSALKISSDGARAAIIAGEQDQNNEVFIAGVIRDSEGIPRGLSDPITLPIEQNVNMVNWVSETQVAVAEVGGEERVTAQILGLDYHTEALRPLLGMTNLSTGTGENTVYAETEEAVYLRVGSSWRAQEAQVRDLNYPG